MQALLTLLLKFIKINTQTFLRLRAQKSPSISINKAY